MLARGSKGGRTALAVGLREIKGPHCALPSLPWHPSSESPLTPAGRELGAEPSISTPTPLREPLRFYHVSVTSFPWAGGRGQGAGR